MPIHDNTIGEYRFIDIQGNIEPRGQQLELIVRPGFDGLFARKTGSRGVPFTIRTVSYATTFTTARAATLLLKELIGAEPQEVIKYSVSHGNFLVLNVREIECRAMVNSTAENTSGPPFQVRMVHEWELVG